MTTLVASTARGDAPVRKILRLIFGIAAVALAAAALPFLPAPAAALLCLVLGAAIALPGAAGSAVRRGHDLGRFAETGLLRRALRGGALRVLWHGALGTALAALLLVRLAAGGPPVWIATAAAVPAVLMALRALDRWLQRQFAPAHGAAMLRRAVQSVAALAVLLASALIGLTHGPPDPAAAPQAASALTDQFFALHRVWLGVEAWLLGEAVAVGLVPPWLAAVLAAAATGATGWAAAALTLALLMPPADRRRAVGPASDAADAPAASGPALAAAGLLAAAVLAGALWAEARLAPLPVEARPVSQVQDVAERIGGVHFRPGTIAAIEAGRAELRARDAEAMAELRQAIDAGFDSMIANVDPFLDAYYTLPAEVLRVIDAGVGWGLGQGTERLETRLNAGLQEALAAEEHFANIHATLARFGLEAERARLEAREAELLASARLDGVNPGLLRIDAVHEGFPPLDLPTTGFATGVETRVGGSVLTGALAAWIAHRIVQRLAARGLLRLAARGLWVAVPGAGVLAGVATEQAAIKLEEYLHRDAFHAEIVAAVEAQREELHRLLD